MPEFSGWAQGLIFSCWIAVVILIPCVIVAMVGRKVIEKLGRFPTRAAIIQMSVFWWLVLLEIITFALLIGTFQFFSSK